MRKGQSLVEEKIDNRIASGLITNADQARKSAAGNIFQQMVAYVIAQNVIENNITKNVIVTTSTSNIISEYAAIQVGEDVQKPDSDVIIYSPDGDTPIMNLSCKTSCRERAGQTYKWKLLCDLATCDCDHKNNNPNCPSTKYGLAYTPAKKILICFVTSDFYNELSNPQIAAMFNFFDYSYVAKETSLNTNIYTLDTIIDNINNEF
jgi:type II restriction enzyme